MKNTPPHRSPDRMKVAVESEFGRAVRDLFHRVRPKKIIETGTYLGTGTTAILASAIQAEALADAKFYSIEVNPVHHQKATANLAELGLADRVQLLRGLSIPRALLPEAGEIERDCLRLAPRDGIYIDHAESERVALYLRETEFAGPDDWLGHCLSQFQNAPDFVLLDSAGHMGFIEFQYVVERLQAECYIALDDVYHIKHHQSLAIVQRDPRFEILTLSHEKFGFCLARFTPAARGVADPQRILYVRTDAIGDAILAGDVLRHLHRRYPSAQLAVLCRENVAPLYLPCSFVHSLITFDWERALTDAAYQAGIVSEITQFQPDLVLNGMFSPDALTELLALSPPAPQRIALAGDLSNISAADQQNAHRLYDRLIPSLGASKHELERHRDFLIGLGIMAPPLQPVVWTSPADDQLAQAFFDQEQLIPARTIALFPGAQHEFKIYPHFPEALRELRDFTFLIFGGTEFEERAALLARRLPGPALNLAGRTSLTEMAALMRKCCLYIGNDSAGAHLACALGIPNVVVLGGGHFGRFFPYSPLTTVVCRPLSCFGCNWRCHRPQSVCVSDIEPDLVRAAVTHALQAPRRKPQVFISQAPLPDAVEWSVVQQRFCPVPAEIVDAKAKLARLDAPAAWFEPERPISVEAPFEVSAVISTCNSEALLRACLENLQRQTLAPRTEIIIVDSGSAQNEKAVAAEFKKRNPNIVYLRTEREGLYAAWNRGFHMARGEFVTNTNTDDALRADGLEKLAAALRAHPQADLAYAHCTWTSVPNADEHSGAALRQVAAQPYHPAQALFYCWTNCHQFWRRSSLARLGGYDARFTAVGDYEILLRGVAAGIIPVLVPEYLSFFYQNPIGITAHSACSREEEQALRNRFRDSLGIEQYFSVAPDSPSSAAEAWIALGNLAMSYTVPWLDGEQRDDIFAQRCYERALALRPGHAGALANSAAVLHRLGRGTEARSLAAGLPTRLRLEVQAAWETGDVLLVPCARSEPAVRGLVHATANAAVTPPRSKPPPSRVIWRSPAPAPELDLPVRWLGPIFNPSGYASEAINFILPLAGRLDLGIRHHNNLYSEKFVAGLDPAERVTLFALRDRFPHLTGGVAISHNPANGFLVLPDAEFNIGRAMYETDRIPAAWISKCNQMDEVWVTSQFNLETFARSGVERDKLVVVPGAVDENHFNPAAHEPLTLPGRAACNFLSVFEWSSRKGWDVLLAAYLREFSAEDDVCLYLRTYLFSKPDGDPRLVLEQLVREFGSRLNLGSKPWPRIEILADQVPYPDLPKLYLAADCLVAPSRGEGWGRPQHEAMMMGLPVIATAWSAPMEFMTPENSYLLDFELTEAKHLEPELFHYWRHQWANPKEQHLRELLRSVQQHREDARCKGAQARQDVVARYSRPPVADRIMERIRAAQSKLTTPALPAVVARSFPPAPANTGGRKFTLAWEGPLSADGSLALVNRALTETLRPFGTVQLQAGLASPPASKPPQITVRHQWPPQWRRPDQGAWIVMQPWEFGSLPSSWLQPLAKVDQIWAYTEYVRRVYVESGIDPARIKIVPLGIDPATFKPETPPLQLTTRKRFKFLFVGGTIHRKGADLLLKQYQAAFRRSDDVCLVVKDVGTQSAYAGQTLHQQFLAAAEDSAGPEILYLDRELDAAQMPQLYAACDCLVHPYRGEGFALPVLEAMACGLPVLVTGGGATDDFVSDTFAYRIPARRQKIGSRIGGLELCRPGWLLEPDPDALLHLLQHVVTHPDEARAKGAAASVHVREHWTWKRSAAIAAQHCRDLLDSIAASARATAVRRARKLASIDLPSVARVGELQAAQTALQDENCAAAWTLAQEALQARPYHPEAVILLAEIAAAAGHVSEAKRLARLAKQMAPALKRARLLLQKLEHPPKTRLSWSPPPLVLRDLGKPRLSVCFITKNEAANLPRALASIRDLAWQIVVVDTGSTDSTIDQARHYGAEVHSILWQDNFSLARNEALAHARGDWILILDADEEVLPDQRNQLLQEMRAADTIAYRLPILDRSRESDGASYVPRLFRNVPGLFFVGRIHEQIFSSVEVRRREFGLQNRLGNTVLLHHGYTEECLKQRGKVGRNLALLERAVEEMPNEPNLLMNFGLELSRTGYADLALEQYWEAFDLLSAQPSDQVVPEFREMLLTQLGSQLMRRRQFDEVVRVLKSPLAGAARLSASLHFARGLAYLEQRQYADAARDFQACLTLRQTPSLIPANREIRGAGPHHCLALCWRSLDRPLDAERAFNAALETDPRSLPARFDFARFLANANRPVDAMRQLHELVAHTPTDPKIWQFGAEIVLSSPALIEVADAWTEQAIAFHPADAALSRSRAEVLLLSGNPADARIILEKHRSPEAWKMAWLCVCQLLLGEELSRWNGLAESAVSREFIELYRKLLRFSQKGAAARIRADLPRLHSVLPHAAEALVRASTATESASPTPTAATLT